MPPESEDILPPGATEKSSEPGIYQVVARRYRPQTFDELVGQEHIAQALKTAVQTGRVGHAYLFAGARGVGKTSTARILAKALNCEQGPTPTPCNRCSLCQEIAAGDSIDVLEIDGASNRGIEEVRALRQNATLRPSRARFKIYIIDEVHMLTREAFNALLKTLEEPPSHVKFIFCTTEPNKIPPTILSRCQRFDFVGISTGAICRRLQQILEKEGIPGEPEALEILARRASGSMRDAQSLLEQVLAFGSGVSVEVVRELLGLGSEELLGRIAQQAAQGEAAAVLRSLDEAVRQGADLPVLIEQLAGYYRDMMVVAAGCSSEMLQFTTGEELPRLQSLAKHYGLETILAALQILDHTLSRMRFSFQPRLVAELGLTRLARLQSLVSLAGMLARVDAGTPPKPTFAGVSPQTSAGSQSQTPLGEGNDESKLTQKSPSVGGIVFRDRSDYGEDPISRSPGSRDEVFTQSPISGSIDITQNDPRQADLSPQDVAEQLRREVTALTRSVKGLGGSSPERPHAPEGQDLGAAAASSELLRLWQQAVDRVGGYTASLVRDPAEVRWKNAGCLLVVFPSGQQMAKSAAIRVQKQIENALRELIGKVVRIEVSVEGNSGETPNNPRGERSSPSAGSTAPGAVNWRNHPLVRKAAELFDAIPSPPRNNKG